MIIKSISKRVISSIVFSVICTVSIMAAAEEIKKISIEGDERIEVVATQGDFSVIGWEQDFVSLVGQTSEDVKIQRADSALMLNFSSIDMQTNSDRFELKVPSDRSILISADNANFSFEGLNPQTLVDAEDSDHQNRGFDFDVSINTVDGNVKVADSSGNFNIKTINGDISILASRGALKVGSVSGNQYVEGDFRDVSSTNMNGRSAFKLRTLDRLGLRNVNGDTYVESAVSLGASIQIQSVKGEVELFVPDSTSARFSLQSHQGGTISNRLKANFDATTNDDGVQAFTLANASASITIDTLDGSIIVGPQENTTDDYGDESFDWSSVDTSLLNFAFVNPNYSIFDYQEIFIKEPEIRFDPNWERRFGHKSNGLYRKRIETEYASLLKAAIERRFFKDGNFKFVDQRKERVLVIIPKVLDLYISDPESLTIKDVIKASRAGNAKIDLVIFSPSDESILALFMDKRSTSRPSGVPIPKTRVRNTRAFDNLFNDWIEDIVKVLDK